MRIIARESPAGWPGRTASTRHATARLPSVTPEPDHTPASVAVPSAERPGRVGRAAHPRIDRNPCPEGADPVSDSRPAARVRVASTVLTFVDIEVTA
jgi:hypothetical protein